MLEKATKLARFHELQTNFFQHVVEGEALPISLWRKLFWYFALTETGCHKLFSKLDDICLFPKKKVRKIRSIYDTIPRALQAQEGVSVYSATDMYCRSDYLSDAFIAGFKGKYWEVTTWESDGYYSSEADLDSYFFEEFFSLYPDRVKTEENYPIFTAHLYDFLGCFLPNEISSLVLEHLEEHTASFLDIGDDGKVKYCQDFTYDVLEEVVSFLRFGKTKNSRQAAVSVMRAVYNFPESIADEELIRIVKKFYDQPLCVNFNDSCYCGIVEYTILKSFSLGFLLTQKETYREKGYTETLCAELEEFYKEFDKLGEVVFPYLKYGRCDVDVYFSENIYAAGCYPKTGDSFGQDENVELTVPSLPDIVLLQWADELYDKCHGKGE